jgi:hypothetical protein
MPSGGGTTNAPVVTGGVESNGPHLTSASQGSCGIHEELCIAAIMSVYNPETIH